MPFTEQRSRERIKLLGVEACENVGDLCYVFYSHLMQAWRDNLRWKTAHRLFDLEIDPIEDEYFQYVYDRVMHKFELKDVTKAAALAYKVFFHRHVMKYEFEKMRENGDI